MVVLERLYRTFWKTRRDVSGKSDQIYGCIDVHGIDLGDCSPRDLLGSFTVDTAHDVVIEQV